jgi:hypothetical protein
MDSLNTPFMVLCMAHRVEWWKDMWLLSRLSVAVWQNPLPEWEAAEAMQVLNILQDRKKHGK